MKVVLTAGLAVMLINGAVFAGQSNLKGRDTQLVQSGPLLMVQRRSSPDTSTPGSTAPGNTVKTRPAYLSQQEQYYAAELRRCENIGEPAERLACKDTLRGKFGEM